MTFRSILLTATVTFAATISVGHSADWPQFLGPNRNGMSSETGLLEAWPTAGLTEVWRVPGGVGMSGLAILDGNVVTLIQDAENQSLVAHQALTGEGLWANAIAPALANGLLYLRDDRDIVCLDVRRK